MCAPVSLKIYLLPFCHFICGSRPFPISSSHRCVWFINYLNPCAYWFSRVCDDGKFVPLSAAMTACWCLSRLRWRHVGVPLPWLLCAPRHVCRTCTCYVCDVRTAFISIIISRFPVVHRLADISYARWRCRVQISFRRLLLPSYLKSPTLFVLIAPFLSVIVVQY